MPRTSLPCMPSLPSMPPMHPPRTPPAMHAPLPACTPFHACPPATHAPCHAHPHAPLCHACLLPRMPPCHACHASLWTESLTHASGKLLPQILPCRNFVAGGKNYIFRSHRSITPTYSGPWSRITKDNKTKYNYVT